MSRQVSRGRTPLDAESREKTHIFSHWRIDKAISVTRLPVRTDLPAVTQIFTYRHQP